MGLQARGTAGVDSAAQHCTEVFAGREKWNLNHGTSAESSSQVGWAGQDPSEMVGVHEIVTFSLEALLNGGGCASESFDDAFDVVTLLHGDNTELIFFVNPDEKVFIVIVEDTTSVGPVATATGGEKESGVWFLEKVSFCSEGFFLLK